MSSLISDFYSAFKWTYLGASEEAPKEEFPPEIEDEIPYVIDPVSPGKAREYAYHISSISRYVDRIQPDHKLEFGLLTSLRIIDLVIFALKKRGAEYKKTGDYKTRSKLEKISDIFLVVRRCQQLHQSIVARSLLGVLHPERLKEYLELDKADRVAASDLLISTMEQFFLKANAQHSDILFPGGWKKHAIMYGIHKDVASETYTFSLWNTGNGLEENHNSNNALDEKYEIRANWSNLTFEQVSDRCFLEKLFEIKHLDESESGQVYSLIHQQFERSIDPLTNKLHREQEYGNCVWKSKYAALADLLDRDEDPRLSLEIKADIIEALRTEILEKIPLDQMDPIDPILIKAAKRKEKSIKHDLWSLSYNASLKKSKAKKCIIL